MPFKIRWRFCLNLDGIGPLVARWHEHIPRIRKITKTQRIFLCIFTPFVDLILAETKSCDKIRSLYMFQWISSNPNLVFIFYILSRDKIWVCSYPSRILEFVYLPLRRIFLWKTTKAMFSFFSSLRFSPAGRYKNIYIEIKILNTHERCSPYPHVLLKLKPFLHLHSTWTFISCRLMTYCIYKIHTCIVHNYIAFTMKWPLSTICRDIEGKTIENTFVWYVLSQCFDFLLSCFTFSPRSLHVLYRVGVPPDFFSFSIHLRN